MNGRHNAKVNADYEEPICERCDHYNDGFYTDIHGRKHDYCQELCGAEHGWYRYERSLTELGAGKEGVERYDDG